MTWEYIAGFFDGEGTICPGGVSSAGSYGAHINMSQSRPQQQILYIIQEFLDSKGINSSIMILPIVYRKNNNIAYRLTVTNAKNIYMFLMEVLPHLIVKKEQAVDLIPALLRTIDRRNDAQERRERIETLRRS